MLDVVRIQCYHTQLNAKRVRARRQKDNCIMNISSEVRSIHMLTREIRPTVSIITTKMKRMNELTSLVHNIKKTTWMRKMKNNMLEQYVLYATMKRQITARTHINVGRGSQVPLRDISWRPTSIAVIHNMANFQKIWSLHHLARIIW